MKKSEEDYLESIYSLIKQGIKPRSIDVAKDLNFSKPSVSVAMKKLSSANLIIIDSEGFISLTKDGELRAKAVYEKHVTLTNILLSLGVSKETAQEDACKLEHDLSEESFQKIKEFYINHIKK